jgi:hypothetical protein
MREVACCLDHDLKASRFRHSSTEMRPVPSGDFGSDLLIQLGIDCQSGVSAGHASAGIGDRHGKDRTVV